MGAFFKLTFLSFSPVGRFHPSEMAERKGGMLWCGADQTWVLPKPLRRIWVINYKN